MLRPTLLDGLCSADFIAEHSLNRPANPITIVRQFVDLSLVFLLVCTHAGDDSDLFHIVSALVNNANILLIFNICKF